MAKKRVHFIGIGGIGMSALARWYMAQNWAVSGSDVEKGLVTEGLKKDGVKLVIGPHKASNIPLRVDLVVHTQAVAALNPELRAAKRKGIPVLSYPRAVADAAQGKQLIAICGAHGKSTTTALAGLILARAGLDPTVIVGTRLKEFGGENFRNGRGDYFVLEADEYGRSFHHYSPAFVICTNVDAEHLDTYKNLAGVKTGFLKFFARARLPALPAGRQAARQGGALVLNRDDANLASLARRVERAAGKNGVRVVWYSLYARTNADRNRGLTRIAQRVARVIKIPGEHNVSNALGALALARALRIPDRVSLAALGAYRGSWRRFEYRGEFASFLSPVAPALLAGRSHLSPVPVYDDYGHHPSEIRATLKGFREKFPRHRIVCVFQPHQAKRLKALFGEFQAAFDDADTVLMMPIYKVAGREASRRRDDYDREYAKGDDRWDSAALVRAMQKRSPGRPIFYLSNPSHLKSALTMLLTTSQVSGVKCQVSFSHRNLKPQTSKLKAIIIMMGAGNIFEYTNGLLKK